MRLIHTLISHAFAFPFNLFVLDQVKRFMTHYRIVNINDRAKVTIEDQITAKFLISLNRRLESNEFIGK